MNADEITIKFMRDQAGNNSLAYLEGVDLAGAWKSTPACIYYGARWIYERAVR